MIENIIGWALLLVFPIIAIGSVVYAARYYKKIRKEIAEREEQQKREREENLRKLRAAKAESWNKLRTGATHVGDSTYYFDANKMKTTVTEQATGKRVSYVHTKDDGPDLLTTMIVADMLNNNKSSSSGSVSWSNDVPSIDTSSSWDSGSSDTGSSWD
jgi:hypothetical protein